MSIAKGLSKTSPDPQAVAIGLDQLSAALRILEDSLLAPYLLGANFTVADLSLRHQKSIVVIARLDRAIQ
jgi:glutathione S-transferase